MMYHYSLQLSLGVLSLLFTLVTPAAIPRAATIPLLNYTLDSVAALNNTFDADLPQDGVLEALVASTNSYTITQNARNPSRRSAAINTKRDGFLYGPPVAGGPYFPAGPLGIAKAAVDQANLQRDLLPQLINAARDDASATASLPKYDGLDTLDDYTKLYNGEWQLTLPMGPVPGVLTNYTQDLLFSMERLSISPYQVRRLNPSTDQLAFQIDVEGACGMSLQQLFQAGRLFYANYRDQAQLAGTPRFAAASDAYFYIDPSSGDFLPLAIRTNNGAGPIYTPEDNADDWLSAKIMYNADDFWFAQWNHLAQTHEVVQIAYMAAIRTLSENHPVKAILDRLMYEVFAIQPLAATILFFRGSAVDEVFAYTGDSAQRYTTDRYRNKGAGRFQANYFRTDLENRGLINSDFGPELKNFPFYEDAGRIHDAIHTFMTSFVNSYYSNDAVLRGDREMQRWAREANGPAEAIDFPRSFSTRSILVDVLTHFVSSPLTPSQNLQTFQTEKQRGGKKKKKREKKSKLLTLPQAHLVSNAHHAVNTNELLSISSTLPFHTASLYAPPPTTKPAGGTGVNPVDYLPPFTKIIESFTVAALFARPLLVGTDRTLLHMFDSQKILQRTNPQTRAAAARFKREMRGFSNVVGGREFDDEGLSQGMPFLWKALDPDVQPYSITV